MYTMAVERLVLCTGMKVSQTTWNTVMQWKRPVGSGAALLLRRKDSCLWPCLHHGATRTMHARRPALAGRREDFDSKRMNTSNGGKSRSRSSSSSRRAYVEARAGVATPPHVYMVTSRATRSLLRSTRSEEDGHAAAGSGGAHTCRSTFCSNNGGTLRYGYCYSFSSCSSSSRNRMQNTSSSPSRLPRQQDRSMMGLEQESSVQYLFHTLYPPRFLPCQYRAFQCFSVYHWRPRLENAICCDKNILSCRDGTHHASHVRLRTNAASSKSQRGYFFFSSKAALTPATPPSPQQQPEEPRRVLPRDEDLPDETKARKTPIWHLFSMARPELPLLLSGFTALGVAAVITMYIPTGFGHVIDIVASDPLPSAPSPSTPSRELVPIIQLLGGLLVVSSVATFVRVVSFSLASHRLVQRVRTKLFASVLRQDMSFFDRSQSGELITRLSTDTYVMSRALSGTTLSQGVRSAAQALFGLAYMLHLSPSLTAVMLAVLPVLGVAGFLYGKFAKKLSRRVQTALAETSTIASECFSGIRTVRAFAHEGREKTRYNRATQALFDLSKKDALVSAAFFAGGNLLFAGGMLGVLYMGGNMIALGKLTPGALTSYLMYTLYLFINTMTISSFYSDFQKGIGASHRVLELLDAEPTIPPGTNQVVNPSLSLDTDGTSFEVRFDGVHFAYDSRSMVPVLRGLSLVVPAGSVCAVVGASGSGKSTLAQLLLRFYDPDAGHVLLNGKDVAEIDPTWLRRQVGIVSQEPLLFADTIASNILYGLDDAQRGIFDLSSSEAMAFVEQCARQANAHDFIRSFPDGYDTVLGERGVSLSGGQRQRIAIARAIARDPRVLILDEATSALDSTSEVAVQEALDRLMSSGRRTTIVIAHRLSTIKNADQIAVLSDGAVAEIGTHTELIERDGSLYGHLMRTQSDGLMRPSPPVALGKDAS